MTGIDVPLGFLLIFLLLGGLIFFTSSEASLFALGRVGLQKLKDEDHPRYPLLKRLLSRPRRLIISLLIGNEAINVAVSSLTSALFIGIWGDAAKWAAIPAVVLLILLFGEVVPKTLALRHPERIAPRVAGPVERFLALVSPLHWLIRKVVDGVFTLAGVKPEPLAAPLTEADFKRLVETGQREGELEETERELIHRVFRLGDLTVRNIMTPGHTVFTLPVATRLDEAVEVLKGRRFSRVPVYRRNPEEIIGVLYAKDLLKAKGRGKRVEERGLAPFLRRAHFVPLTKKLDDLLREFQRRRIHLAVVVDEYGRMAGIVTLEDLLEELFGEIYDELDADRLGAKGPLKGRRPAWGAEVRRKEI